MTKLTAEKAALPRAQDATPAPQTQSFHVCTEQGKDLKTDLTLPIMNTTAPKHSTKLALR